jgi:transglutaminase-like putative cysteine protease
MRALSADARRDLPLAAVAAATTWLTMLSWRGFTDLWGHFLGPLILVAIVVPLAGALLRAAPLPRQAGALLHLLVIAALVWLMLGGSVIHPVSSTHHLADRIADAWLTAENYQPPIPATVPDIAPLLIPCGALALFVVDALACWLRRVPLAGLPLLAVYCVPMSIIGEGVSWVVFLLAACGFLLMMFLQESAHVTRWGRPLRATDPVDAQGFGVRTGASKAGATSVGSAAVVLAVVLPVFIPTLHLDGLGLFGPGGNGDGVKVVNPITDMRRNLRQGADVPLLTVRTDDPDPSYLRIAVLTQFNGVEWSTGNRSIISDQTASGLLPLSEQGLGGGVPRDPHNYTVTASTKFDSRWLPTQFPASSVRALGDWHWDATTMDFIAANDSTNTAGLTWTMTAENPRLSNYSMINSLTAPLSIQEPYTATPSTLPTPVSALAHKVTASGDSRFAKAVLLQDWFRTRGGFRYSLKHADEGDSNQALLDFLTPGKGHRVGYCEQFASAFAVMARTLDLPTRVAIGFLEPKKTAASTYVFSAHDMHAWPEVYFRGSGWVRFEPTPAARTGAAPAYTTNAVTKPQGPKDGATSQGGRITTDPTSAATTKGPHDLAADTASTKAGTHLPWVQVLVTLLVLAVLAAACYVPGAVRRARRRRRLTGGVEDAWVELRDSAIDLGVTWPAGRSPRETGHVLSAWFGPEPDGAPLVRPPRGRGLAPVAQDALDRIVLLLEQARYARSADDVRGGLADDVRTCITALEHGSTRGALRRARWLPRSLFGRGRTSPPGPLASQPEAAVGSVDHVG